MKEPIKVFIGYDHAEAVAYHTLCHSIMTKSSVPVSITPICLDNLKDIFTRKRDKKQSNAFSFSRFLVPYLCNYKGKAIFMDCDMLLRTDIAELFEYFDFYYAVQVVKHDYIPKDEKKYLGNEQHVYELISNTKELTEVNGISNRSAAVGPSVAGPTRFLSKR